MPGKLIAAGIVARTLGVTRRTVCDWVRDDVLMGACIKGRWYVKRDCPTYLKLTEPCEKS